MYRALIDLFGYVKATTIYTPCRASFEIYYMYYKNCDVLKKCEMYPYYL